MADTLAGLLDRPDQDDRLTIGTIGLVHIAVGELLGIVDGWNRRGPEPAPKVGNAFSPAVARAHLSVTTAKDDAQGAAVLIQAGIAGADKAVLFEALDKLNELVGLLNKAGALLTPHAALEEGGA